MCVDEQIEDLTRGDRLAPIGEVIAIGERQHHQLRCEPIRVAAGSLGDRGGGLLVRQRRRQVDREIGVKRAEQGNGAIRRRLARQIAADDPHSVHVLVEAFVNPVGHQGVALHLPDHERVVANHPVDDLVRGT